ncbi:GNAT family N-acetyltransferase [Actinomyces slackii]|uniref:Acetyltransferase (GNAT) family n=1 Tax=Actinomyces slackii TaxID=52774 RepID=A0A3S4TD08_9ACTO|nr:GNAT family N-acetyltransferase [Actinomyces slackii]VEG75059.1 Acetyltransferase (GNAT) family [Actinomyces slackii]
MAPVYGYPRGGGRSPWAMLRPGPRSSLPRQLSWMPLGPEDNAELAALIARAEAVDNPPYRTTAQETADYFVDPIYSGVAGRDQEGVMRAFGLVRLRPAGEIYASMTGVVDPVSRRQGIGGALLHWQAERARHLVGAERAGHPREHSGEHGSAHVVTTVLEDDERMQEHLDRLGFAPKRWYREVRRSLALEIPSVELDRFLAIEPWSPAIDDAVRRAHNQAMGDAWGAHAVSPEEWVAGATFVVPQWSFVAMDRSGDRGRVAGYLRSSRYEQDWEALGWREGYTDMLGVLSDYRHRQVGSALLTAAMRAYAVDGMDYAAAGMDTDNPSGATELYESLGYEPTRGTILYVLDV